MKEIEARQIAEEIRKLCRQYGLWISVKEEYKPNLRTIRIEEISLKIEGKPMK